MLIRQALLGGTFDPFHVGHLDIAEAGRAALGLPALVLLPSNTPPHRRTPVASAPHRFAMAALATQDRPAMTLSDLELGAPGPSYTDATLDRLATRGLDTRRLAFIIGADAFRDIASWKNYPAILDRCHFVVVSRAGVPAGAMRTALAPLADRMVDSLGEVSTHPCILLVEARTSPVSSTDVRDRLAAGRPIDGLVPPAVAAYIAKHGLYEDRKGAA